MNESTKRIDAKGLPCPQPVVLAKKALEEGGFDLLEVVVDNAAAVENVSRFAAHGGHAVESVEAGAGETVVRIRRAGGSQTKAHDAGDAAPGAARDAAAAEGALRSGGVATVFVGSSAIGSGSDELGELLMKGFLSTLMELPCLPERIILMNGGVKLAVEGSPALDKLTALAARGVEILSCGTCLDYYKVKDRLAVGRVTNMFEIAGLLMRGSVLRL
jgi:selenium metabolism protein YedF